MAVPKIKVLHQVILLALFLGLFPISFTDSGTITGRVAEPY